MIVYCITNKLNNKQYVGQTRQPLHIRWRMHKSACRAGIQTHLYAAMRKYGFESFMISPLASPIRDTSLDELERILISHLGTLENGYNMTEGGEGAHLQTPEAKRRQLERQIGRKYSDI